MPLLFQPGKEWHYGFNCEVIGRLIEIFSGMSFDEFLRKRLFEPLEMVDTDFYVPDAKQDRVASMFMPTGAQATLSPTAAPPKNQGLTLIAQKVPNRTPRFLSGGGGLWGTITDYFKFCNMLVNGGEANGIRFLSRKTIDFMLLNQIRGDLRGMSRGQYAEIAQPGCGFGLGFAVVEDQVALSFMYPKGCYFWGGAANTIFWIDPKEKLVGIFLTQVLFMDRSAVPLRPLFASLVYGAVADQSPDAPRCPFRYHHHHPHSCPHAHHDCKASKCPVYGKVHPKL